MIAEIRQKEILDYILANTEVSVQDLSRIFDVSEMTIRRDLVKLEKRGLIRRTYGGAIAMGQSGDTPVAVRLTENLHRKIAIAQQCAKLVQPKETIIMDAGTTVMEVARRLPENLGLTVVTNAITVVNALIDKSGIELFVLGGPFQHASQSTMGSNVIDMIQTLHVDRAFITATGFSVQHGLSDANIQQSEIKRRMMRSAKIKTLVIDSAKYGLQSFNRFSQIKEFDQIITDEQLNSEYVDLIKAENVELILAPLLNT